MTDTGPLSVKVANNCMIGDTPGSDELMQNNGHHAVQVIQSHQFWYQSIAHVELPVSDQY